MSALAEPTGGGLRLREPKHLVSPRAKRYWLVRALALWVLLVAVQVFLLATVDESAGAHGTRVTVLVVTLLLAVAHLAVMPQWRYRVHRWEATDTAVYTQSGWLSQQRRIAPLSRIQTVDSARGPLEQLFGLANITVTTASAKGPLKVEGLDRATAERLVDDLTRATGQAAGDAT